MQTAQLTIQVPVEAAGVLQRYAEEHHTTLSELLVQLARRLSPPDARPLHPDIVALTGLVPAMVDAEAAFREHLLAKHR